MKRKAPTKISLLMFLAPFLCGALPVFAQAPALRANGRIAFVSNRDGNREIYVMNADGTNQVRLTNNSVIDDHPAWSPDGMKIAFVSQKENATLAIFIMNGDGTQRTAITAFNDSYWATWRPLSWSPDGRKIAFHDASPVSGSIDIFVVNIDGSGRQDLTADHEHLDLTPTWSPDGSKILFSRYDSYEVYGGTMLHTINADGTNLTRLQNGFADGWNEDIADWSPAGDKIVFMVNRWDFVFDLYIANPDGTGRQFFHGCDWFDNSCRLDAYTPTFSPDGKKIAFSMFDFVNNSPQKLYAKNLDGTALVLLTDNGASPSWQPIEPGPNPIDRGDFFIRQQYLDFLEREPEAAGLQFYLDILNGCHPADTECVKYTRGALSANFFRSPEFGRKGAYVANLFNIVIGQRPKTVAELNDATKVERPHYAEFMADLATLSTPNDDPVLTNQKKDQLASAWLARTEVLAILPNGLSNQQFVQKLESIAGVTLANESTLIADLNNGSQTRAQVLRAVAESNEVVTKFYIPNFVTMEYLGFLRRDPEDCHVSSDPESCGFIFHNRRFNTPGANPDLIENIIVRGFIESPEYRSRFFGPWDY